MGGAGQAAIGTVELTVLHRLAYKKKSLQLYVQGLLLFAAVCYNTAWQPLCPSSPWKSLVPEHMTWLHSPVDLPTLLLAVPSITKPFQVCILFVHAIPTLTLTHPHLGVPFLSLLHPSVW